MSLKRITRSVLSLEISSSDGSLSLEFTNNDADAPGKVTREDDNGAEYIAHEEHSLIIDGEQTWITTEDLEELCSFFTEALAAARDSRARS
jgi:hypothetical protein